MLRTIELYFLLFFTYSVLGWIMEVTKTLIDKKKFVNRGFLIGPYCPIYGYGVILLTILLKKYQSDIPATFIFSILICGTLEYFTSYFMEKIFKTRWWDYTRRKFNLNGRICLETMIPFGILGCVMILVLNPIVFSFLKLFSKNILIIISIITFIILIVDYVASTCIIFNFRNTISNFEKDATEEITKKVKEVFMKKGYFSRRLIKAFPTMIGTKERLVVLMNKVSGEIKNLEAKSRKRLDVVTKKINIK